MLTGSVPMDEAAVKQKGECKPFSLVFGNEGSGLPVSFAAYGTPVRIRQSNEIDSLNLSIAASIGMYSFSV